MHKLINQLTLHDLKEHAKLLGKYLDSELGIKISHSSVLNLAARGFGFKDFNTIKSHLDKMAAFYVFSSQGNNISLENLLSCVHYVTQHVTTPELLVPGELPSEDMPAIEIFSHIPHKYGIKIQENFLNPEHIVATINKNTSEIKIYIHNLDIDRTEYMSLLEKYKSILANLVFVRTIPDKELDTIPFALLSQQFGASVKYESSIVFGKQGLKEPFASKDEKIEYLEKVIERLHRVIEVAKER